MAIELYGPGDPVEEWRNPDKKGTGLVSAVLIPDMTEEKETETLLRFAETVKNTVDATFGGNNHGSGGGWYVKKDSYVIVTLRDGNFTLDIEMNTYQGGALFVGVIFFDGDATGLSRKVAYAISDAFPNSKRIEARLFNTTREPDSCSVSLRYE